MSKEIAIAIDGPAGSGKSTIAKAIAGRFNYIYIDSGAMYRAVTLKALQLGLDLQNEAELTLLAHTIQIQLQYKKGVCGQPELRVIVDGNDESEAIRSLEVTSNVSVVAAVAGVREAMVNLQRKMADASGVVMDGRDIGTVVLPGAELKVFLTASAEERGKRRWLELQAKGIQTDLAELTDQIRKRDLFDSTRQVNPLRQAPDAILLDTTSLTIEEVIERLMSMALEKGAKPV
ncbi:cytidylate kinase [Hydrogenispora ethanolica]|jgi:cytidylate kinase|uniref:Cytidylate kinase n=1 Tax=Hydrogenispora ethanolica TaxID=1082276 RepID=A0A4R1RS96_HYDET|nr:(d)CMP kinase [Hydrogenispora ethanolica]TCL69345.1 cytidylate kinase [Hydrogenispora ethanolica]